MQPSKSSVSVPPAAPPAIQRTDGDPFLRQLLNSMLAFSSGDFTTRMPSDADGRRGQDRRCLQRHRGGQRAPRAGDGACLPRRRQGGQAQAAHDACPGRSGGWADEVAAINTLIDDLVWPTTEVTRAVGARGQGRPRPVDGARGRRASARRRVPALGEAREQDDRPALGLHLGGDARRARSRHRRQARRPGAGEGRVGRVEGPDGVA